VVELVTAGAFGVIALMNQTQSTEASRETA
jgi:hypothetical protein